MTSNMPFKSQMNNSTTTSKHSTPYDSAFYDDQLDGSLRSAQTIVPLVVALLQPRSVVDIGCGVGTWLKTFADAGIDDYLGIDGHYVSKRQLLIDSTRFIAAD